MLFKNKEFFRNFKPNSVKSVSETHALEWLIVFLILIIRNMPVKYNIVFAKKYRM